VPIQVAGEGWIGDLYDWFSPPQWMQIYDRRSIAPLPDVAALPTVVPEDVRTAETCFRKPDGWIVCVPWGIWEQSYRNQGFPEISPNAPEFVPPVAARAPPSPAPPVVVSSDPPQGLPEDEAVLHGEGSLIDWGVGLLGDWLNPAVTPIYNFGTPQSLNPILPAAYGGPVSGNQACGGCRSTPCVCGTINGRAALVDPVTGKRCYKRRRPKLLSDGDFNSLMRIATLPNNQNVRIALAKAIGRR